MTYHLRSILSLTACLSLALQPLRALDLNANGMSDVWEDFYGITDPAADPDGDGQSNLKEAQAFTDPNDSNDYFKTTDFTISADFADVSITWRSVGDRYYEIEQSADLVSWSYATYSYGQLGSLTTTSSFVVDPPPGGNKIFFRVHSYEDYDPDNDGLSYGEEFLLGTDPYQRDSDGDGMSDDYEFINNFDPMDPADGALDADGDLINNAMESRLGTNPRVIDSDGNGIPDGDEDKDQDGLTNIQEITIYLTDPVQPDTDGDSMNDGWEVLYGFNPLIHNSSDLDPDNDATADPDTDGLTNEDESQIGTNPNSADTDGDGFSDFDEDRAGSNAGKAASTPSNPGGTPGGPSTPAPPTIPVMVNFGDHSGSHSEKYRINFEPLEGDANSQKRFRTNRKYGVTQTETFYLPAGAKYKVTFEHIATDPQYIGPPSPDYDYTLTITSGSTIPSITTATSDPSGILGVHDESVHFFAAGKDATLYIPWIKSSAVAAFPFTKDRKKLGVGELVDLSIKPASLTSVAWSLSGTVGTSTLTPATNTASFEAGVRACTPQAKATVFGKSVTIDFNVIEPTGEQGVKDSEFTYAAGAQGVGMLIAITTLPIDVSFSNVEVKEIDKGTSNVKGFFASYAASALEHHPTIAWIPLSVTNKWSDRADLFGFGTSATWATGTFQWAIEVRWRVTNKETGAGVFLANRTQTFFMHDNTGKTTITKLGQTVERTP